MPRVVGLLRAMFFLFQSTDSTHLYALSATTCQTRFQAQSQGVKVRRSDLKYGRVWQSLRMVYAEQGLRGLYSGTVASEYSAACRISKRDRCLTCLS